MNALQSPLCRLGATFVALTTLGVAGPAHAEYDLRPLGYQFGESIDDDGRVAAHDGGNGDGVVLEGPIAIFSRSGAQVRDFDGQGRVTGNISSITGFLINGPLQSYTAPFGLPPNGMPWIQLNAIADGGGAVGSSTVAPNPSGTRVVAIEWTQQSPPVLPTQLTVPNRVLVYGEDISPSGDWVVGRAYDGTHLDGQAILWDSARVPLSLPRTVSLVTGWNYADEAEAYGVNDAGDVVGSIGPHPVLWPAGTHVPQHLGLPLPGTVGCRARAINETGTIVGDCGIFGERAFVWHPGDTTLTDLDHEIDPALGWSLDAAFDINESGQITGFGTNPAGATEGFVLSPERMCMRPCEFPGGVELSVPRGQCETLGGTLPPWTTVCREPTPVGRFDPGAF